METLSPQPSGSTGGARRLLLVSASAERRAELGEPLSALGFAVVAAEPGPDAWAARREAEPQMVLFDLAGDTDALEALVGLEQTSAETAVPVLAIHDADDVESVSRSLHHGADDFIVRPFSVEQLALRLEVLWRVRRLHERVRAADERVQALSSTDGLTGLLNRRGLERRLELELRRVPRFGIPVACIFLECDHLQRVAEVHGRAVESHVIKEVGRLLVANLRETDLISRYDEHVFVLGLPGCEGDAVVETAERLRQLVSMTPVRLGEAEVWTTLTAGVEVVTPSRRLSLEGLLEGAAAALRRARSAGGDRVARAAPGA